MSRNGGTRVDNIPVPHPLRRRCCARGSEQVCTRRRGKAERRTENVPPCHDRRPIHTPCCWSAPLLHFGGVALLPVAASTTIVPVMCGCKEQKYWYVPGVVNVNENLSSLSRAFDLKLMVVDVTVCGMSSSLVQVTVVPDFTFNSCGPKVKFPIFTETSSALAGVVASSSRAATPAKTVLASDFMLVMLALRSAVACRRWRAVAHSA